MHRKLSIAALLSVLTMSSAAAAGLGKLTVLSSLGQPLVAEIELTSVASDEAATLAAKLASPEAFQQANIDLNPSLLGLQFSIEQTGTRQFVRVTSPQPMNEPFVDLLLEVSASNGRLVREYTFLLDPPELRAAQGPVIAAKPATVAVAVPATASAQIAPLPAAPVTTTQAPAVQAEPAKPASATKAASLDTDAAAEVTVKKGDTLSKIALQHKVSGVSLDQMLVSLYRANPDAFVGKNMNRLRAGRVLTLPASEDAAALAPEQARREVTAQAVDFTAYRDKLARQAELAQGKAGSESAQSASGKMNAKVNEQSGPAAEAKDKLKLSKSMAGTGSDKGGSRSASVEDKIAQDKAKAEDAARIKELERTNAEVQKLLEMKNKELAQRQKQAELDKAKPAANPPAPVVAVTPDASIPVKPPVPAKAPAATESLLDSPFLLPGAGILALLLGGLGFYAVRRKLQQKKRDSAESESVQASDADEEVTPANAKRPAVKAPEPEPSDPIAEADVYIAYGRDEQAEVILKEALKAAPDRHAVRAKLMEIYVNRQDAASYEMQAHELLERAGRQSEFWLEAAATGLALDPENPLYGGKEKAPEIVPEAVVEAVAAVPAAAEPEQRNNIDDLDFDLEGFVEAAPKAAPVIAETPADATAAIEDEFAAIEDTLSRQDAVEASTPAAAPMDFDLSDITLDLEPAESQTADAAAVADESTADAAIAPETVSAEDEDLTGDTTEMATKLDLAIAYQEIGDNEGARELLEEVVEGGTLEQIIQARTLMQKLG